MTAYEIPGQRIPVKSGQDLVDKVHRALTINANGEAVIAAEGAVMAGVSQREAVIGEAASVMINGVSMMYIDALVANGAKVAVGPNGGMKPAGDTDVVVGVCLFGGNANELGSILIK